MVARQNSPVLKIGLEDVKGRPILRKTILALCGFALLAMGAWTFLPNPKSQEKISVIWQVDKAGIWESDWIKEVLAGVDYEEIQDGRFSVFKNRSIIIVSADHKSKRKKYFKSLQNKKYTFGVIQLSDETYAVPDDFYKKAAFILRNYWHKNGAQKTVAFPLGYKRGFWDGCSSKAPLPLEKRKYTWSFAGQIEKSTRIAMINSMKKVSSYHVHEINSFGDTNSLGTEAYRQLLQESIFVPCPKGWWNLDSFRVYEALECGCIPIVEKAPLDYFTKFLGPHPFLSVENWEEAPALMEELLSHPDKLKEQQEKTTAWWINYKAEMIKKVATLVEEQL